MYLHEMHFSLVYDKNVALNFCFQNYKLKIAYACDTEKVIK